MKKKNTTNKFQKQLANNKEGINYVKKLKTIKDKDSILLK